MHRRHARTAKDHDAQPGHKEIPGDRPPILPLAAAPASGIWFLLMAFVISEIELLLPYLSGASPTAYMLPGLIFAFCATIPVIIGLRYGKIWSIRVFRITSYLMAVCYFPILASTFYLWLWKGALKVDSLAPDLAIMFFIFSAIEPVGFFFLFRALKRVRWLDPTSLPHEWEPPATLWR